LFWNHFKIPPQIPGRKSVGGVGSDGVGHAKHAREDSPDVSPGFMFNFMTVIIFLVTLLTICCKNTSQKPMAQEKPNILLISLDTLRFDATSLSGEISDNTPFLKNLAKAGANFINAYSTYDETPSSHFSMLTGYIRGLGTEIDSQENSIAFQLHAYGYNTFGIAANGCLSQHVYRYLTAFQYYVNLMDLWNDEMDLKQKQQFLPNIDQRILAYSGNLNDFNRLFVFPSADQVLPRLKRIIKSMKKPFFGFVNFNDIHDPYFPNPKRYSIDNEKKSNKRIPDMRFRQLLPEQENPEKIEDLTYREYVIRMITIAGSRAWSTTFDLEPKIIEIYKRRYEAEIRELDSALSNLFGYLWEENLQENTIIIITSDHGESFGELNLITHSFNNQGDRESTHHVPLLLSFPQTYRFKSRNAQIACTIADIPPTIYDILGIDWLPLSKTTLPGNYGKSLLPYIRDGLLPVYDHSVLISEKLKLNQQQRNKENHKAIERLKSLGYIN